MKREWMMVLACVVCIALSTKPDYCTELGKGPTVKPLPPPPGLSLVSLQVLFRHGDRLPTGPGQCWPNDTPFNCSWVVQDRAVTPDMLTSPVNRIHSKIYDARGPHGNTFPGSCAAGQLTSIGYQQHLANGRALRQYYVDDLQFLPTQFNPSQIYIRSTDVPRTIQSAQSMLQGLYPNKSNQYVDIHTVDQYTEVMVPNGACLNTAQYDHQFQESALFKAQYQSTLEPLQSQLQTLVNNPHLSLIGAMDCMLAHVCHDLPLPAGVTPSLVEQALHAEEWVFYQNYMYPSNQTYLRLGIGGLMTDITSVMKSVMTGAEVPAMVMWSGHDTTLMPFMTALGVSDGKWVPYASTILIELWNSPANQYYVRMIYNGKVLPLAGCPGGLCDYAQYFALVKPYLVDDWTAACTASAPPFSPFDQPLDHVKRF